MKGFERSIKQAVEQALDELPPEKMAEVLDFVLFLKKRWAEVEGVQVAALQKPTALTLRTMPASHLDHLTGLVAWGGDAVADAEHLYNGNN